MEILEAAMDYGISEFDFWEMTPAEIERAIKSKKRIQEREAKERAAADYVLADLIGISVGRCFGKQKFPSIDRVYPTLFKREDIQEREMAMKQEASVIRFKQFADAYNKRFKEANKTNE